MSEEMSEESEFATRYEVADLPLWRDADAYEVLTATLLELNVTEEVFAQLVSAYRSHAHKQRTRGLTADFDDIFQSVTEEQ